MKEPQVLVTERAKLNLGSDSLRSKSSNQSVIDQVIEMLTAYVLKSDYNVDKAILNQQINDILSRLDNIPSMNIDDFLSLDSENPVQNKIITAALNAKPDKDTTYTAGTNVSIDSNNVISAVDTKYTAGNNVSIINNVISATDTTYTSSDFDIKDLSDSTDLKSTWNNKQDQLTAGTNITIENNVISATGGDGLKQVDLTTYADGVEGEIVQHIGSTTEDYIHGYVYKLSPGKVVQYEDVTIPSGSTKITYTNKFDQSQKIVYSVESISLSEPLMTYYSQSGSVYVVNDEFKQLVKDRGTTTWLNNVESLTSKNTKGLVYGVDDMISDLYQTEFQNTGSITEARDFYYYINSIYLENGYRLTVSSKSVHGKITDSMFEMKVPEVYGSTAQTSDRLSYVLLSELEKVNWDPVEYIRQIGIPTEIEENKWCYDNTKDIIFTYYGNLIVTLDDGSQLLIKQRGKSGDSVYSLYRVISSDGKLERYINPTSLNCVYNSKPVESNDYFSKVLDIDLYFDYNASLSTTSESITIHRVVPEYDENGFPVDSMGLIWQRIDVQPANQLTAGDGITIDSNNVISTNLWTSVTD